MGKSELEKLQNQVEDLQREMGRSTGNYADVEPEPEIQTDFVAFGSDRHMGLLGIARVDPKERAELEGMGVVVLEAKDDAGLFRLVDSVYDGMNDNVCRRALAGKVSELTSGGPEPTQSVDALAPNFAPTLFTFSKGERFVNTTEQN